MEVNSVIEKSNNKWIFTTTSSIEKIKHGKLIQAFEGVKQGKCFFSGGTQFRNEVLREEFFVLVRMWEHFKKTFLQKF